MSRFVNGGVQNKSDARDIPTKAALKRAIAENPANVVFYVTDAFGPNAGKMDTVDKLDNGFIYSVTGPNPYNSRKWYANIQIDLNGKITVK